MSNDQHQWHPTTLDISAAMDHLVDRLVDRLVRLLVPRLVEATAQPRYLSVEEAARYMAIPTGTFRSLATRRLVPVVVLPTRRLVFDRYALDEWALRHSHVPPHR